MGEGALVKPPLGLARLNTRGVGEGYLWPDLTIIPEGAATRVVWWDGQNGNLRYQTSGEVWVGQDEVLATFVAFVEAVLERLRLAGITGTQLEAEWSSLRGVDADEVEFCRFMGDLGLDPFADDPPAFLWRRWRQFHSA